jgi:hypothetical protein
MAKLSKSERREIRRQNIEKCQAHVDNTYGKNLIKVDDVLNEHVYFHVYKKKFELPEDFDFKAHLTENENGVVLNIYTGMCEENAKVCNIDDDVYGLYEGMEITDRINLMFDSVEIMEYLEEQYEIEGLFIEWKDDIYSIQLTDGRNYFQLEEFESKMKAYFRPSDYEVSSGLKKR